MNFRKNNIRINAIAPTAGTRMTEDLMPEQIAQILSPEAVTAGLLTLCDDDAPNRTILCAGAGGYATANMFETEGIFLAIDEQSPEAVRAKWLAVTNQENQAVLDAGVKQSEKFVKKAMTAL